MTIAEMHTQLNLRTQKIASFAFDNILATEKDNYLNKAIDRFIKSRLEPKSNAFGLGFEQSVKRIEDLRALITTSEIDTNEVSQALLEGWFADSAAIPSDFMFVINLSLLIQFNDSGVTFTVPTTKRVVNGALNTDYAEKRIPAKIYQHDDIYSILRDPFNAPNLSTGGVTVDSGLIYSYTDNKFITDKVVLTYLRQPAQVSLSGPTDCDLSENVHEEIVDIAAELILSDIEALGKGNQIQSLNDLE